MLNVKPSRFNLVVEPQEDGRILLFNTFSNALCLINKNEQCFLSGAEYDFEKLSGTDRKVIEQLLSMGFIVNQDVDELNELELQQNLARYGNRVLTLTIGPTLNCNMCCPYCFEAVRHQAMTRETAEKLIHFVKEYIKTKKIEAVRITWYGGEPLLELRRIEQISNELIPFCEEQNIPYSANIITNGFCLDRASAELLKSLKVSHAQITIDGLEETHNARRKLKSGDGSFWPIVKNIESAKDILSISIRVNVDKNNLHEIDALADFFLDDMKWGKNPTFYLAPVNIYTEDCNASIDECLSPDEFSSLYQRILGKMFAHGITEVTEHAYPQFKATGCAGICINSYVVDALGYLYTCWNHFGDVLKSIGNIDEPSKIGQQGDYYKWMTIPISEKCKDCVYLPVCQGGCPDQRIKSQNQPSCGHQSLMCIENLKLAFKGYTAKK